MMNKISKNYITVCGWMVEELQLKGSELLAYALIYGFSQDDYSDFHGSISYIAGWLGTTKRGTIKTLNRLEEKGYIMKAQTTNKGIMMNFYKAIKQPKGGSEQSSLGGEQSSLGSEQSSPNIYKDNPKRVLEGKKNNIYSAQNFGLSKILNEYISQFIYLYPKTIKGETRKNVINWFRFNVKEDDIILMRHLMQELNDWKKGEQWTKDGGKYITRADIWLQHQNPQNLKEPYTVAELSGKWLPKA